MDIRNKTIGELIDSLITTSMRCWFAQEKIVDTTLTTEERLQAAIVAQQQNATRSSLIRAINIELGYTHNATPEKTYSYEKGLE